MDNNKMHREKLDGNYIRILCTNPGSNTSHTSSCTATYSHLKNHPNKINKTCEAQLEKQR